MALLTQDQLLKQTLALLGVKKDELIAEPAAAPVVEPTVWETPTHEEIPLHELDPVELGLDPFASEDDAKLVDAIIEAKRQKAEPLPSLVDNFRSIALRSLARGEGRVLPIAVGGKNPLMKWKDTAVDTASSEEWKSLASQWIDEVAAQFPDANVCVIAKPEEMLFIDEDQMREFRAGYEAFSREAFPRTFTTSARDNRAQSHWLQTDTTRKLGNVSQNDFISVRQRNLYVLAEGSQHKNGIDVYRVIDDSPIASMPDKLVEYIRSITKRDKTAFETALNSVPLSGTDEEKLGQFLASIPDGSIPFGEHDDSLTSVAGTLRRTFKMDAEQMKPVLVGVCERCCAGYGTDYEEMCEKIANSVARYEIKDERVLFDGKETQKSSILTAPADSIDLTEPEYAMTPEEVEAEYDKEYPRLILAPQAGPEWDDKILYGPVGQLTKLMAEYNEGHPVAIYLGLLVSLGNAFGRHAHFEVNNTMHYTNEFVAFVGTSSVGRKGSARDSVNSFMRVVDPEWSKNRILSGFGSGESIVNEIRDDMQQSVPVKQKGKAPKYETITVPGIEDKRLLIRESELTSVFTMAGKENSLASSILRNGWDGNPLSNIVKGKSVQGISNSTRCENPHVSITGDISKEELISSMPDGSEHNGFGNRFLYAYVNRTKECPHGGPKIDWTSWLAHFDKVIKFAKKRTSVELGKDSVPAVKGYMPWSPAARKAWNPIYHRAGKVQDTLTGKMTSRAQPHIHRLAMIFALVDLSETIEVEHLRAAKQLWDYCEDSARYIFSGATLEQWRIVTWLKTNGPATTERIRSEVFQRNKSTDWVKIQLADLTRHRKLSRRPGKRVDSDVFSVV
jgi:hypothetical protein